MTISIMSINPSQRDYEFVERKGRGHPDTISDRLAEEFSRAYSLFTLHEYGIILHHNFDKTGVLGGHASVGFGKGSMTRPIRVLLNGRASSSYAGKPIPVEDILKQTARDVFSDLFPMLDLHRDIEFHNNLSMSSSPGSINGKAARDGTRKNWFTPRGPEDIPELRLLAANDTSLGSAYSPLSPVERTVLDLECTLTREEFRNQHPWLGTDVKVMASRLNDDLEITLCVPQICSYVSDVAEYRRNVQFINDWIYSFCNQKMPQYNTRIFLNMRDNFETCELYLTFTGSAIENGDEGLVGRGNRPNGVIANTRPFSIEGACGKNPVYHVGKVYNIVADNIAREVWKITGAYSEAFLVSQTGQSLIAPWKTVVGVAMPLSESLSRCLNEVTQSKLDEIPRISASILKRECRLY
ncbi:methionine adenosyltransferase [Candidatus Woesearchaeota archaeon]|nr:methionine adenosyltransferase [Candidatus Woesearchaeota archaeon]